MHTQALDLLQQCVFWHLSCTGDSKPVFLQLLPSLSQNEDDVREKLQPTVTYLQKLGEEYIDQIFKSARWVFQQDQNIALEVRSMRRFVPGAIQTSPFPLGRSSNPRMSNSLDLRSQTFSKPSTQEFVPDSSSTLSKRKGKVLLHSITDLQSCTSRWRLLVGACFLKVLRAS